MRSITLPASRAGNIIHLLSIVTLCLAILASLVGARRVAAVQPLQVKSAIAGGLERDQPLLASARPGLQTDDEALQPSDRARLLFAELVFGATILAAPLAWLGHVFSPPVRRKKTGFPWGRLALAMGLLVSVIGLAGVFGLARHPLLLRRGFLDPVGAPAGPAAWLRVPLAVTVCALLLVPLNLAHWRQKRPPLRRVVSDCLVMAAALVLLFLLWG